MPGSILAAHCRHRVALEPGERTEIPCSCWVKPTASTAARALLNRYGTVDLNATYEEYVIEHWNQVLGVVQVKTPDRSCMDIVLGNRWLQISGARLPSLGAIRFLPGQRRAYGFRDQLGKMEWRWPSHDRTSHGSIYCAPPAGSFRRGTYSTGGCRRSPPCRRRPGRARTRISDDVRLAGI